MSWAAHRDPPALHAYGPQIRRAVVRSEVLFPDSMASSSSSSTATADAGGDDERIEGFFRRRALASAAAASAAAAHASASSAAPPPSALLSVRRERAPVAPAQQSQPPQPQPQPQLALLDLALDRSLAALLFACGDALEPRADTRELLRVMALQHLETLTHLALDVAAAATRSRPRTWCRPCARRATATRRLRKIGRAHV